MQGCWDLFVVQCHCDFDQSRYTCSGNRVADVAFDTTDCTVLLCSVGAVVGLIAFEHAAKGRDFDRVADWSRGSVSFDVSD